MIDETIMILIDSYYKWLKEKTTLTNIKDWIEITTPYIDRHNDYIQIYIKKSKGSSGSFTLTDDGYIIDDLLMSGVKLDSQKRKELLRITLNSFGVTKDERSNALCINANMDDFPLKKHNLVQAILAINDMFYAANAHVANLFLEDVKNWMDSNDVRYTENINFKGKSGFDRKFDFVIPKSKISHERLIKVINDLNKNTTDSLIMDWIDTKEIRTEEPKAYVIINDVNKKIKQNSLDFLKHYDIQPILWTERENFKTTLVA
ncbi:MAG: DUF1829 domain-containing protein [Candidatus Endomicrobiellum trichonymphae]|uniref:DUF1829 domain-containing protein n=1 Tax=Endomicrobium trichonymphae TaxID=1408204 RepID=UPI0027D3AF4F|nr:MAG: DUF1829 domain-containing protein [Candidatus Endomicrobium trichonymphae]